jgi:TonB-linked SusC/RagA family outer membrane protein
MKRIAMFLAFFVLGMHLAIAQTVQITGTVTSNEDGQPLPGAAVVVKGTKIGTSTDFNGKYSISVPADAQAIVVTFVGMKDQELAIAGRSIIDVVMQTDATKLDEVVVTALGIKRSEKTIGYASSSVNSEEFSKRSSVDAMNSLQGKIAGVNITSAGGAPGASTKVIIRGFKSLSGNNNPLYVVDGMPINNGSRGADGIDYGNRANDINPDDIESMEILKGAAATALYGPRGANGVIMITLKKGKKSDKINVELSSSYTVSDVLRLPQMQNTFGQGWSGHWTDDENGSWGPMMDGKIRLWGNEVDGSQKIKAFSPVKKNLYDFYDFGKQYTNSVSISGGSENAEYKVAYSNTSIDGYIPTDADKNKKNILTFTGSTRGKKLTASTSISYVRRDGNMIPDGDGGTNASANLYSELLQIPRDFSIVEFKDYKNDKFNTLDNYFTPYAFNPYYALNENQSSFFENRVYGNVDLNYKILEWLSVKYRVGVDASSLNTKQYEAIMRFTPGSYQSTKNVTENPGMVEEYTYNTRELNQDFFLTIDRKFNNFTLNGVIGYTTYQMNYNRLRGRINSLIIPEFYNLSNTDGTPVTGTYESNKRLYGYFLTADIGYKEYGYLNLSVRRDHSSTLPKDANSFTYPAATLALQVQEIIPSLKDYVSLFKIRAAYGKAGNDAAPYSLYAGMVSTVVGFPFSSTVFPINGIGAFEKENWIGATDLKPEITTEKEIGFDLRFWNSRARVDFAYYNKVTSKQILSVVAPPSSGFSSKIINFGDIENKGIELLLSVVPVKTSKFSWETVLTYAQNKNKVLDLPGDETEIVLNSAYDVEMVAIEGQPLGIFRAPDYVRDDQGHIVVNASNGIPLGTTDKTPIGDIHPKYTMGFVNTLKYKDFTFSFVFDYRPGGYFYSGTADLHYFVGNATQTTFNNRQPFLIPNSVVANPDYDATDVNSPEYIENTVPIDITNVNAYYYHSQNKVANRSRVIPKDYLKLREINFSYSLPKSIVSKVRLQSADIILSGRNIFLWTPKDNNFVDPESSSYGNDLAGEFGEFRTGPTTKSFTVGLKLSF